MTRRKKSYLTFTDQFCGAGGSTEGAKRAGLEGRMALNHWKLAVSTHQTNHPEMPHECTQDAVISRAPFFVQYYGTGKAHGSNESMPAISTRDRHAMVTPDKELTVDDCYFRMLQPHEIGAAMAFPGDYVVHGNKRDKVKQFGNAVTPPAMEWLIRRIAESFGGAEAA